MLEKLLAAEVLVIRVLDPLLAHHFVAEVVGVLENREPRHQPGRQRRPAGAVGVNRPELLFQKSPVDRPRQLHQRVVHVDDLVEPRAKQILLAAFPPFPWPHRTLPQSPLRVENHGFRFEGIPNPNLQENRCPTINFRQIQSQQFLQFLLPVKRFRIFHGRPLKAVLAMKLNALLEAQGLTQAQASKILGMPQPKISAIRNYKLRGISLERLMQALTLLGQHVRIVVSPSKGRSMARIDVAA